MDQTPDTPPDGDFARYVEQLSARSAATVLAREAGAVAPTGRLEDKPAARPPSSRAPARRADPAKSLSMWSTVRWALLAWIALQVLEVVFPRIGMLSLPLFLVVVGWVLYRFKQAAGGATGDSLRRLAERAAKEFNQRK